MKYFLPLSILLLFCISFTSCSHLYYVANPTNVPLLTHKGDAKANANLVIGERFFFAPESIGFNLAGSYALSDKFGIMGSGTIMSSDSDDDDDEMSDKFRRQIFEVGVGRINSWIGHNFLFEVFAGTGYIAQQHFYNSEDKHRELNAHAGYFFLQPNMALKNKTFSLAISPKLVWVKNYHVADDFSNADIKEYDLLEFKQNTGVVYLEPTVTILLGNPEPFNLKYQMKFIAPLEHPSPERASIVVSIGIRADLDELFSKKENEGEQK